MLVIYRNHIHTHMHSSNPPLSIMRRFTEVICQKEWWGRRGRRAEGKSREVKVLQQAISYQPPVYLTISLLSDSCLNWNKLLKEALVACLCSLPSRKPSEAQEEITDILESELCLRGRGVGPFNWGSLSIRFNDISLGFQHLEVQRTHTL